MKKFKVMKGIIYYLTNRMYFKVGIELRLTFVQLFSKAPVWEKIIISNQYNKKHAVNAWSI